MPAAASRLEPFMEWINRTDMDTEWISGGYGYFFVKSLGMGRITDLRYQDGANHKNSQFNGTKLIIEQS